MTTIRPQSAGPSTGIDESLFFVGNATVLLRYAGMTVLTDPNFIHAGEEVSLGYGLTSTRLTDPAIEIDDLPPVDLCVLSHFHADHFDRLAEERLDPDLPIVTTPQAAVALRERGFRRPTGLDTWQTYEIAGPEGRLRVTSLPARHAPALLSVVLPDVMGTCLEYWPASHRPMAGADPQLRLYITGDTIIYEGLREIPERVPEFDLALLHLGGTRIVGVTVTMDAEQGVELLRMIRPTLAIPIHYDDYDSFKSPLSEFVEAVRAAGLEDGVRYIRRGETVSLGSGTAA